MADLGVDIALISGDEGLDLDPYFNTVTGRVALIQSLAQRYEITHGDLWYDEDLGCDLRRWLNADIGVPELFRAQVEAEAEALKDERVQSASALATFDFATSTMTMTLTITDADGEFELVLDVTAFAVKLAEAA